MVTTLDVHTHKQGLYEITSYLRTLVHGSGVEEGLCSLFIQHTSASLVVQENADSSAIFDLEHWIQRLVPERDPHYTHLLEGPDDMPAHIRSALTDTSLSIPIRNNELMLGRWQGVFVWEHRRTGTIRHIAVHISP
ncbi:MAG: secondary thiamine-phosphate synthase enzyme YjbQ [Marinobacterium sp.]|nr:secondary thiamine-phosphate synthase enzyme YjbQ [Marinobacterium sp.]